MINRRSCQLLLIVAFGEVVSLAASPIARAQGTAPVMSPSPPSAPESSAQAEARARFNRALELVEDGDFDAAVLELQRAYDLAPSYRILYNIGLVSQQLKQYARAYDAFDRYLKEGGAEVPPDRVDEVTHRIERLKGRVAYLTIETDPPGAEIFVDDAAIGRTPFSAALRVNSGQRKIRVTYPSRESETQIVELAGGERRSLQLRSGAGAKVEQAPRNVAAYIGWGTTGALTAAAVTTGILALTSTSSYDKTVNSPTATGSDISSAWDKAHTFALSTDILTGAAVVAAGVSLYYTLRPPKRSPSAAGLIVLPGGIVGQF
jgi:hypothetical protein